MLKWSDRQKILRAIAVETQLSWQGQPFRIQHSFAAKIITKQAE